MALFFQVDVKAVNLQLLTGCRWESWSDGVFVVHGKIPVGRG